MPNLDPNRQHTHEVLDLAYHEDEGQSIYSGSEKDCNDYIEEAAVAGEAVFMYKVSIVLHPYHGSGTSQPGA